jgi:hypothetical protein
MLFDPTHLLTLFSPHVCHFLPAAHHLALPFPSAPIAAGATGLTSLELRSTHGTHIGGLARLTSLQALAHLSLSDREYSTRASHQVRDAHGAACCWAKQ